MYQSEYDEKYEGVHLYDQFHLAHPGKTLIWSHRGGYVNGPQNSRANFEWSKENNVDGVECDVWMSSDGELVLFHGKGMGSLR